MENKTAEENSLEDVLRWMDEDIDKAFERLLPSDEYGENEDAALIWQVVKDSERLLKYTSLQCAEMKKELDELKKLIASDSVYWALRNAVKSPSTLGDVEDDNYQDLYTLSSELKKSQTLNHDTINKP